MFIQVYFCMRFGSFMGESVNPHYVPRLLLLNWASSTIPLMNPRRFMPVALRPTLAGRSSSTEVWISSRSTTQRISSLYRPASRRRESAGRLR